MNQLYSRKRFSPALALAFLLSLLLFLFLLPPILLAQAEGEGLTRCTPPPYGYDRAVKLIPQIPQGEETRAAVGRFAAISATVDLEPNWIVCLASSPTLGPLQVDDQIDVKVIHADKTEAAWMHNFYDPGTGGIKSAPAQDLSKLFARGSNSLSIYLTDLKPQHHSAEAVWLLIWHLPTPTPTRTALPTITHTPQPTATPSPRPTIAIVPLVATPSFPGASPTTESPSWQSTIDWLEKNLGLESIVAIVVFLVLLLFLFLVPRLVNEARIRKAFEPLVRNGRWKELDQFLERRPYHLGGRLFRDLYVQARLAEYQAARTSRDQTYVLEKLVGDAADYTHQLAQAPREAATRIYQAARATGNGLTRSEIWDYLTARGFFGEHPTGQAPDDFDQVVSTEADWGRLPGLTLVISIGALLIALANWTAFFESAWAPVLMYAGLTAMFVPAAARLLSAVPSRRERLGLIVVLGLSLYFVKILRSPVMLTGFDELLHWRTAHDILKSGHLFHGNSLLPVSPLYPGLEIVVNAVNRLTGLPVFEAGILVIGAARVLTMLALYLLFEEISQSGRVGGIAALLYTTNLGFVFFDAQFSYESVGLPLGLYAIYLIARRLRRRETQLGPTLAAMLVIVALIVTHHLTSFAFLAFLILLFALSLLTRQSTEHRVDLARIVAFTVTAVVAWLIFIAPTVIYYLSPYTFGAVTQMLALIFSQAVTRPLFVDYAGQGSPLWERFVSLASVALVLLGLPWGLIQIWRRYRGYLIFNRTTPPPPTTEGFHPGASLIPLALGLASLAYGATLPLRLVPSVAEVSARSAGFLFVAIAFVLTLGPVRRWLAGRVSWKRTAAATLWATILFAGGFILGAGPSWARLPGPYLVAADLRSIEPEGIAAANWAAAYLGAGNRVAADRVNALLMGSYGFQRPLTDLSDQFDISPLYFATEFGEDTETIFALADIHYMVVDRRLSTGLPRVGVYFQSVEPSAFRHSSPIPLQALDKFEGNANMSRLYHSGNIVIYKVHDSEESYRWQ